MKQGIVNWGILGCGNIANTFAQGLNKVDSGNLVAVASNASERAKSLANKYQVTQHYTNYVDLVTDPNIHAVYIATPHNFHFEQIKLCLEHGKHVLCEKPITINAQQCQELILIAKSKNLFLMEALWTRFLPAIMALKKRLEEKIIGDVLTLKADFSIVGEFDIEHRLKNKNLAGGALLDLGIYPLTLASIIFGDQPSRIQSSAVIGETGVDERSFYLLEYEQGQTAVLSSSFSHHEPTKAIICGTKGYIEVPNFFAAQELHINRQDKSPQILKFPFAEDENFTFEIAHVNQCINVDQTESHIMPLSTTLAVMKIMDTLRAQWGLRYQNE